MVHPVHKDNQNLRLDALLDCGVISKCNPLGHFHGMVHNLEGSGGVSLRNDGENPSFHKVVYMFHIRPAK